MLIQQNAAITKEINDLKRLISNLENQRSSSVAAQTVVIGKVDCIHRTLTKETPVPTKTINNNNKGKKNIRPPAPNSSHRGPAAPRPPAAPPAAPKTYATVTKNG